MEEIQIILKIPHSKARIKVGLYPIEKGKINIPFMDLLVAMICKLKSKNKELFFEKFKQIAAEEILDINPASV